MDAVTVRHRPGGHKRGEETRRLILDGALEMFATLGYQAASTRLLAERAKVNLSAIQYYFGSKEGLYQAVVRLVVEHSESFMAPVTSKAIALLAEADIPRDALIDAICDIVERFVSLVSCGEQVEARRRLWARAEAGLTLGLEELQEEGRRQIFDPCLALVARLFGRPPDDPEMLMRTVMLFGQVTIFFHDGARQLMGRYALDEECLAAICALVRSQTRSIFRASPTEETDR